MSYKKVEFFSLKFNFLKRVEIKKGKPGEPDSPFS